MVLQLLQYGLVSVSAHWFQQDQSWETLCSENKNTYFSIYPSTVGSERTGQEPWFSPSHLLAFLLARLSRQSRHWHLQFPFPRFAKEEYGGCPGYPGPGTRELQGGYSKLDQHVKPKSNLVQILPSSLTAGWMKEMLKITAWCQLLSRPPPIACCGLWSVAPLMPQPWPLKPCAHCQ